MKEREPDRNKDLTSFRQKKKMETMKYGCFVNDSRVRGWSGAKEEGY